MNFLKNIAGKFLLCLKIYLFQCAIFVAVLNVQNPILLGGLINTMTKCFNKMNDFNFIDEMKRPALLLFGLYAAQVIILLYIISLL